MILFLEQKSGYPYFDTQIMNDQYNTTSNARIPHSISEDRLKQLKNRRAEKKHRYSAALIRKRLQASKIENDSKLPELPSTGIKVAQHNLDDSDGNKSDQLASKYSESLQKVDNVVQK